MFNTTFVTLAIFSISMFTLTIITVAVLPFHAPITILLACKDYYKRKYKNKNLTISSTMTMSFTVNMTMFTLAVVTLTVRSFHYTCCSYSMTER